MSDKTRLYDVTAEAGAHFVEEAGWLVPEHFGDPAGEYQAAREKVAVFDISPRGKIELYGPESLMFLHNLCTNDVKNLPLGAGCEAFLTTAKAKVVAHVLIGHYHNDNRDVVWLDFVPGMADKVLQHLNHYLISEQVELADRTREIALLHVCGSQATAFLNDFPGKSLAGLPELHHETGFPKSGAIFHIRRHDLLGVPGYDLFCRLGPAGDVWKVLSGTGAAPAGSQAWDILRVEAGTPQFGKDIDDQRQVMEVGRTTQAICYTKGCFLGQEPIVMARDRGHVNRTLLGLKLSGSGRAAPGSRLLHNGNEVGQVTSSVVSPRLGPIALAYLKRGSQEAGTRLQLEPAAGGRQAEVSTLPFI